MYLTYKQQQSGVALISVLLVFALITMLAAEMLALNFKDVKKTQHQFNSRQAYYYALGGEALARQILHKDFQQNKKLDAYSDNWAQEFDDFNINEGKMSIKIIDLQSRFNLNNIISKDKVDTQQLKLFKQLQQQLDSKPRVAAVLQDWLDADQQAATAGAEDATYKNNASPYLTANAPFYDVSELRLLQGLSLTAYAELSEYVTTLPSPSLINLNTVSVQLLKALAPGLTSSDLQQIEQRQKNGGYEQVSDWLNQSFGAKLKANKAMLAVNSEYFEVSVKSLYDGRVVQHSATLHRDPKNGEIRAIKHQLINQ